MRNLLSVKSPLVLFLIGLLFLAPACSDNLVATTDNQTTKQIGETSKLQEAGRLTYAAKNGSSFEVKVLKIEDSRCPEDVVCIWAGEANVEFQVADLKKIFKLCLGGSSTTCYDTAEFTYEGKDFAIRLVDVSPYPNTSKPNESKLAVFVVSEL